MNAQTSSVPVARTPAPRSAWKTDGLLALGLGTASFLIGWLALLTGSAGTDINVWTVLFGGYAMAAPLVLRRRWPSAMLIAQTLVYMPLIWLGWEVYITQVIIFLAFYSVGAWDANRRRAFWTRLVVIVLMFGSIAATFVAFGDLYIERGGVIGLIANIAIQYVVNIGYFGGAWFFGNRAWKSALEREDLEQAHAEIRDQQSVIADQAVELERVRIARELHDVVAHHVSAMGVQAGAARRVMHRDPERAEQSLRLVESSAREAIDELRAMVTTLRSDGIVNSPLPTLAEFDELIQNAIDNGQRVSLERIGELPAISPAAELTIFRVTQEGLTNARKHAGERAQVIVRLRGVEDGIELEVSDSGRAGPVQDSGTGHGIIGMRERVHAVGGRIETGPKSEGGWMVRVWVPGSPYPVSGLSYERDRLSS